MTVPDRAGLGAPVATVRVGGEVLDIALRLPERSACAALERLGECDSITVDPHKMGYIPYPAGAVCFRSDLVKPIARQEAAYIVESAGGVEAERRSEGIGAYTLEGSRPGSAAAAVWLSHSLIPLDASGHGALMRETIRAACELHALLENYPALAGGAGRAGGRRVRAVCLCPPGSNIVCYAFVPAGREGVGLGAINALNRRVYEGFTLGAGQRVYDRSFFVSRTTLSASRYSQSAVGPLLERLGVSEREYEREGVFLLRSVLMSPWYGASKARGRYVLSELCEALYRGAEEALDEMTARAAWGQRGRGPDRTLPGLPPAVAASRGTRGGARRVTS
ncbi:MAG: hypothetical protein WD749_03205 [Phycisphaerales bacterium]